jgi:hypothetical protein
MFVFLGFNGWKAHLLTVPTLAAPAFAVIVDYTRS